MNERNNLSIHPIPAWKTHRLRQAILRPHQSLAEMVYERDDFPLTLHAGAFWGDEQIGTASIYPELMIGREAEKGWRLRGMATTEQARGSGAGRALIGFCLDYIRASGGTLFWCNARTPAAGFYEKLGFQTEGGEFTPPGLGPHFMMWRRV